MKEFIEIPFGAKDSELCGWEYTIPEGFVASIENGKIIVKKEESEGEKIRKEIVEVFKSLGEGKLPVDINYADIFTWLEKQGETFTKKDVDDAYLKGICDAKHELEKQGEQNPAWSEDDEDIFNNIILYKYLTMDDLDWLKSLKNE